MKFSIIAGVVLLLAGSFVLVTDAVFTTKRDVLEVGGVTVTVSEKRPIGPWLATIALVAGLGLVIEGVRRKA